MKQVCLLLLLVVSTILLASSCTSGPCLSNVDRWPIDPGTEPMIIIDKVKPGSSYSTDDYDGCATGRVFNVDYKRVRIRFLANGWPQPWFDSFIRVNDDGTWYCATRKGETFKACLISEPEYLEDQGTPYNDDNIEDGWTLLDCEALG